MESTAVLVVPLNGAAAPDQTALQNYLNATYKSAIADFTVTVASDFQNTSWDTNTDGLLEAADATLFAKYSPEMRALRDAYVADNPSVDKTNPIVFVVPGFENGTLDGYMVRGRGVGFIKAGSDYRTYAHELGHGAFEKGHPFPDVLVEGSSDNLMDYASAEELSVPQWMDVHENLIAFSWLDNEEAAAFAGISDLSMFEPYANGNHLTFISPSGNAISIPKRVSWVTFSTVTDDSYGEDLPVGVLRSFNLDGERYGGMFSNSSSFASPQFHGYMNKTTDQIYIDTVTPNLSYVSPQINIDTANLTFYVSGAVCFSETDFDLVGHAGILTFVHMPDAASLAGLYTASGPIGDPTKPVDYISDSVVGTTEVYASNIDYMIAVQEYFQAFGHSYSCERNINGAIQNAVYLSQHPELYNCMPELETMIQKVAEPFLDFAYTQDMTTPWIGDSASNPLLAFSQPPAIGADPNGRKTTAKLMKFIAEFNKDYKAMQEIAIIGDFVPNIAENFVNLYAGDPFVYSCMIRNLPFDVRMLLLNNNANYGPNAFQNASTTKERFLCDLVQFIPTLEIPKLIDSLAVNDHALFWDLYDEINDDNAMRYTEVISSHLIAIDNFQTTKASLAALNLPVIDTTNTSSYNTYDKFALLYKTSVLDYLDNINPQGSAPRFMSNQSRVNNDVRIEVVFGSELGLWDIVWVTEAEPFDLVRIVFADDFQFTINEAQLQAGNELVLPAFMAYNILKRQSTTNAWTAGRVALEVVVIAATVGTMTPVFVALEIGVVSADISLQLTHDLIASSHPDMLELHNYASMTTAFLSIGIAAPSMISNVGSGIYKLSNSFKMKLGDLNQLNRARAWKVAHIFEEIKNAPFASTNLAINQEALFLEWLEQLNLYIYTLDRTRVVNQFAELSHNASGSVFVNNKLVGAIKNQTSGDILFTPQKLIATNTDVSNMDELLVLENIKIKDVNGAEVVGDLQLLRKPNGSVVARITDVEDPLIQAILLGRRGDNTLAIALENAGFNRCGAAVRKANTVNTNNTNGLDIGDPQLPNVQADYSFIRNNTTYQKAANQGWKAYFDELTTPVMENGELVRHFNQWESHHIFPVDLFKSEAFRKWYELVGYQTYDINGLTNLQNLIMLEAKRYGNVGADGVKAHVGGVHTNHPQYTTEIENYITNQWDDIKIDNPNASDDQIAQIINADLVHLSTEIKKELLINSVKGDVEISTFWDFVNFDLLTR